MNMLWRIAEIKIFNKCQKRYNYNRTVWAQFSAQEQKDATLLVISRILSCRESTYEKPRGYSPCFLAHINTCSCQDLETLVTDNVTYFVSFLFIILPEEKC